MPNYEPQHQTPPPRPCDGTGWRTIYEGMMPCHDCNPALHRVFSDQGLLHRWRHGEETSRLINLGEFIQPEAYCQPDTWHEDPSDPVVSPSEGREYAYNAYVAECTRTGTEGMSHDVFMHRLGAPL